MAREHLPNALPVEMVEAIYFSDAIVDLVSDDGRYLDVAATTCLILSVTGVETSAEQSRATAGERQ
jgi:hypothetical protein